MIRKIYQLLTALLLTYPTFQVFGQTAGPNSPSTGTATGSGANFTNIPGGLLASNDMSMSYIDLYSYPTCSGPLQCYYSQLATLHGFGFSIPTNAIITGIQLDIMKAVLQSVNTFQDSIVMLTKGGTGVGSNYLNVSQWPQSNTYVTYGSPTDLWGTTWLPSDINDPLFGFLFQVTNGNIDFHCQIDHAQITVYYTIGSAVSEAENKNLQISVSGNKLVVRNYQKTEAGSVILMNLLGKQVMSLPSLNGQSINLEGLPKGAYLIQIKTNKEVITKRFVY